MPVCEFYIKQNIPLCLFIQCLKVPNLQDANDCLRYWHEVKTFLGRNKWRIDDDDYKWKIFRTVIIDIETRTQETKDYFYNTEILPYQNEVKN